MRTVSTATQPILHPVNWGIPLAIALSYGVLAVQPDLRLAIPLLVVTTAIVTTLLAVTLYIGEKYTMGWTARTILLMATILRLLFLFRSPELSDDIYRYLWDGLQTLMGNNPYALAPADVQSPSGALAQLAAQINHPNLVTLYPPAAQIVFAAGASLGGGVLGLKILLIALDLLTCCLVITLLDTLHLPTWRAVLYAWHPLPVLEIAGSGHIDGTGLLFSFGAFLLVFAQSREGASEAVPPRSSGAVLRRGLIPAISGLAMSCAGMVKLFPLLFLPGCLLLLPKGRKVAFSVGFLAGGAILSVCFLPDLLRGVGTLGAYAQQWEFSGFVYKSLLQAAFSPPGARGTIGFLFVLFAAFSYAALRSGKTRLDQAENSRVGSPGPHQRFSGVMQTNICVGTFRLALNTFYGISMVFLLLTPTLFPWYGLYLAGFLPFSASPAGLVLSWSIFLSYEVLIDNTLLGQWVEGSLTPGLIWLAPVSAFFLSYLSPWKQTFFRSPRPRK